MEQPLFVHSLKLNASFTGQRIIATAAKIVASNVQPLRDKNIRVELCYLERYRSGEEFVVCQLGQGVTETIVSHLHTIYVRPVLDNPEEGFNPGKLYTYVHVVSGWNPPRRDNSVFYNSVQRVKWNVRGFALQLGGMLDTPVKHDYIATCVLCGELIAQPSDVTERSFCPEHGYNPPQWNRPV